METYWKWKLFLFIKSSDNTPLNRQTFAEIFSINGSNESVANERKLFDGAIKLSTSGELPPQVIGINTPVKQTMRDDLEAFLDTLGLSRYYALANTDYENRLDGELLKSNKPDETRIGEYLTWDEAIQDLFDERGLIVIRDSETL